MSLKKNSNACKFSTRNSTNTSNMLSPPSSTKKKNKLREKCSTTGYLKWTTSLLFHDTDAIIKTIFKNFIGELEVFINLPQNK